MSNLNFREVTINDLDRCFEIESVSYAGDEAASKEKISHRIHTYPQGFVVLENEHEIIGFINSGATDEVHMSDDDFKDLIGHDPNGSCVVIMSVVVHPTYQGQGFASMLMNDFINKMKQMNKSEIYLMCQTELVVMYEKFGFMLLGQSESDHGGLTWHEMSLSLVR